MKNQNGFTLIELVIVIVLLGVLAAIAVPRFVNLQDDALRSQLSANAAAITSAMNINYAACAVNNFTAGGDCLAVDSCDDASLLLTTPLVGYTITPTAIITGAPGTTAACTLTQGSGTPAPTATFTAVRTAPTP
ncbi:type II secretion system protein [Silanimonas sp.]|uniref:type II secretion system protein n=1 Tax=Silanimonas sp. TaxID=1929290 RepID=UPI001BBA8F88|nr:type II secretion system protein [Silanimonas sp.]MBS3896308.1 prepilin-type N-terminal cleavage/methylation domain-containing protein [Silanimonas sp.]